MTWSVPFYGETARSYAVPAAKVGPILLGHLRDLLAEGNLPLGRGNFSDVDAIDLAERGNVSVYSVTASLGALKRRGIVEAQDMGEEYPVTWQIVDTEAAEGLYSRRR